MNQASNMTDYDGAAIITGIQKPTLYNMVSKGAIPHFRLGGRLVRFSKIELEQWLNSRHRPADEPLEASNDQ